MAALTIEQKRAVALANARARAADSSGIPEGREGTRYDFLPPTSQVRQLGNMFDVARDVFTQSQANAPTALGAAAQPFVDMLSGAKRGVEDLTQGVPALFGLPGARDYKNQKEEQYQAATQNRLAAQASRLATQAAITYPVGGVAGTVVRAVAPALKVAPSVVKATATALETSGFKAPNVLAKVAGGGTTAAGGAVLTDQDVGLSTLIGAGLPVVAPAAGKFILYIFDKVTGSAGAARAAAMMRQALGDKWQQALQVLKSAPGNLTATQALQEAGIEAPIFSAMGRDIEKGLGAPDVMPLLEQQAQNRTNVLAAQAGGPTATTARTAQGEAKDTLNALTKPVLNAELGAANIGGKYIPGLEAQAQQSEEGASAAVDKVRTMMPFSEKMADQGINPNMKKYVGSAPYDVLQTDAQRTAQYYAGRAENLGTDEAAKSLTLGKASRDATQIVQNLRDAGLEPLNTKSLTAELSNLLDDPNFAANDELSSGIRRVVSDIQEWTAKGGGVIDARALYSIRKNSVNAAIRDLLKGALPDVQEKAAAGAMSKINPMIDKAIEAAGGTGWRDYLTAYSTGMKDIERLQLSAKAAQMLKDSPKKFLALVNGNDPKAVEKIFGPGSYDIVKQMDPSRMQGMQRVAGELERDARIDKLANVGQARAAEILKGDRSLPARFIATITGMNPKINAAVTFADALAEIRLAPKTQEALIKGFTSGKSAAELMSLMSSKDRLAALKIFNNPSFWRSPAAVTTNALAPANANTNALTQ